MDGVEGEVETRADGGTEVVAEYVTEINGGAESCDDAVDSDQRCDIGADAQIGDATPTPEQVLDDMAEAQVGKNDMPQLEGGDGLAHAPGGASALDEAEDDLRQAEATAIGNHMSVIEEHEDMAGMEEDLPQPLESLELSGEHLQEAGAVQDDVEARTEISIENEVEADLVSVNGMDKSLGCNLSEWLSFLSSSAGIVFLQVQPQIIQPQHQTPHCWHMTMS